MTLLETSGKHKACPNDSARPRDQRRYETVERVSAPLCAPKHVAARVERVGEDGLLLLIEDGEAAALHCSGPHQPTPG